MMPQAKQELRKVAQVQDGQRIRHQGAWYLVNEIKKAKKWAEMQTTSYSGGHMELRKELDAEVMVEFNVPTVEERRERNNRRLLEQAMRAADGVASAKVTFDKNFSFTPSYALEWADALAEAAATWDVWNDVLRIVGSGDGTDMVTAALLVREDCDREFRRFFGVNRSTSVFTNAMTDYKYRAMARFADFYLLNGLD